MSIRSVTAVVECEGCAEQMEVEIDTGRDIPAGWDVPDLIKDAVRGGGAETSYGGFLASSSVQGDKMLCGKCTAIVDAAFDDEHKPSAKEVSDALAAAEREDAA